LLISLFLSILNHFFPALIYFEALEMAGSPENLIKCLKHRGHYYVELRDGPASHSRRGQQMMYHCVLCAESCNTKDVYLIIWRVLLTSINWIWLNLPSSKETIDGLSVVAFFYLMLQSKKKCKTQVLEIYVLIHKTCSIKYECIAETN